MGRLEGKVGIVTGAAQGIGEAIVRRFIAEGAKVVLADVQQDKGMTLARELGPSALFQHADVTSLIDWSTLVAKAVSHFGALDILVNNAGGAPGVRPLVDEDDEWHRSVIGVNLTGCWGGMRAAVDAMKGRNGSIVNISSIDGLVGVSEMASYVAAKFGVTGLTKAMALEFGRYDIRVNSVHPGVIGTPLVQQSSAASRARIDKLLAHQPIPRMGKPEEIASAVLFFASDESSYCTGSGLVVDGGHIAGPHRVPMEEFV